MIATLPVGKHPQSIATDPEHNRIYVANVHGDSVTVIDGATNTVMGTLRAGKNPYALAVDRSTGHIYTAKPRRAFGDGDRCCARIGCKIGSSLFVGRDTGDFLMLMELAVGEYDSDPGRCRINHSRCQVISFLLWSAKLTDLVFGLTNSKLSTLALKVWAPMPSAVTCNRTSFEARSLESTEKSTAFSRRRSNSYDPAESAVREVRTAPIRPYIGPVEQRREMFRPLGSPSRRWPCLSGD